MAGDFFWYALENIIHKMQVKFWLFGKKMLSLQIEQTILQQNLKQFL